MILDCHFKFPFKTTILAVMLISGWFSAYAQSAFPNVDVWNLGYINEPSICINPNNTSQMVGGANNNRYFYSNDGGLTWTRGTLSCSWGVWGDPVVIVDTSNYFYFFHLSYPSYPGWWIDRMICQRSTNGGQSWSSGTYFGWSTYPKAQDKEWAVVDRANNNIYVTWTQFDKYGSSNPLDSTVIMFTKSVDQGLNWITPLRISKRAGSCIDGDNATEGAVPTVGPDGQIYVAWAGPLGLMFDRSFDQGATWLETDSIASDFPGGWDYSIPGINRANGLPVTSCDVSGGPNTGNVYINWSDQRNGTSDTDVWFIKSTDQGLTWTDPLRVNDDPPGKQQFFTWMTVDQATGVIYIVFYDRRDYDDTQTDVYLAVSTDGGTTFENMRISQAPFIPNYCPTGSNFFGDYTNISAHNNIVRPIWATCNNSTQSIKIAIIDNLIAPVLLNCGSDVTVPAGSDQATVDAAYAAFIASTTASGGCNGVLTNNAPPEAPPAGGGNVDVTWTYTTTCVPETTSCTRSFTVIAPGNRSLSGILKYNNLDETPLAYVPVRLQKFTEPAVDMSNTTLADGSYIFGNLVSGNYSITPIINMLVEDINSTDAALVNYWGAVPNSIEYATFLAGDVNENYWINGTDALKIQRSFVYGEPFIKGPWSYWKTGVIINSNSDPLYKPFEFDVTIEDEDITDFDLYAIGTGDFNGSFIPGYSKADGSTLELIDKETKLAGANTEVELPVRMMNSSFVGAASLILDFPSDLIEVTGVTMEGNNGQLDWSANGGELRAGWNSLQPLWLEADGILLTIHGKIAETFGQGDVIRFSLAADPLNELADGNFNVIPDAVLGMDAIEFSTTGTWNPEPGTWNYLSLESHPNPFATYTTLTYHLPADGHATLLVSDLPGRKVALLVDAYQTGGRHSVSLDAHSLQPGVYLATLTLHISGGDWIKTIKLVRCH